MAERHTLPIQRVVGYNCDYIQGLSILFEKEDGSAGFALVSEARSVGNWDKIRFVDKGPEVIIFEERVATGIFSGKLKWDLIEIRLLRASAAPK